MGADVGEQFSLFLLDSAAADCENGDMGRVSLIPTIVLDGEIFQLMQQGTTQMARQQKRLKGARTYSAKLLRGSLGARKVLRESAGRQPGLGEEAFRVECVALAKNYGLLV